MNTAKIVFFYIFLLITIVNTILMYVGALSVSNMQTALMFLITLSILLFNGLLMTIAASSSRRKVIKNSFRIQLVLIIALVIASIVLRVLESIAGSLDIMFIWRLLATGLYFVLFLFTIGLSRDVFKVLVKKYEASQIKEY
ncbi:MAG: hypothetical protein LAT82_05900 [Nanoarchaeota archaeon]|nr:hypothetical protein [Nanoarchaeota archaeon]